MDDHARDPALNIMNGLSPLKYNTKAVLSFVLITKTKLEICITAKGANVLHNGVFILSLFIRLCSSKIL